MASPMINPGNQPSICKPRDKRRKTHVPCGIVWSFWCPYCTCFSLAYPEDVTCSEAKCDTCKCVSKLDIENASASTPVMPVKRMGPTPGIRMVRTEWGN